MSFFFLEKEISEGAEGVEVIFLLTRWTVRVPGDRHARFRGFALPKRAQIVIA
jgi:hypothetical protein